MNDYISLGFESLLILFIVKPVKRGQIYIKT